MVCRSLYVDFYMCSVYGVFRWSFLSVFFFFKQKTAYEMRISDWSSDVCSSDLLARTHHRCGLGVVGGVVAADVDRRALHRQELAGDLGLLPGEELGPRGDLRGQVGACGLCGAGLCPVDRQVEVAAPVSAPTGRGACRYRVVEYVSFSVATVSIIKKN